MLRYYGVHLLNDGLFHSAKDELEYIEEQLVTLDTFQFEIFWLNAVFLEQDHRLHQSHRYH
jgi:hypothetical protein